MDTRGYRAFISYSHRDESWARWLHRALEAYRLPAKLVGRESPRGRIPRRLTPVFRDRDELSSAADLSGEVREALSVSDALIVICSPASAASRWVNEEIREFRRLGRGDRIFAVIVDGTPEGPGSSSCFPPALLEDGVGEAVEPLAADARKWADGRRLAKLKLVAGILAIPLDSLRRRDLQRRQRLWTMTAIAAVALVLVVALAVTSRIAAEKRRSFAEELVGFKLTDLGSKLSPLQGDQHLARLREWTEKDIEVITAAAGKTDAARERRARELRESGIAHRRRGEREAALSDLRESWLLFARLYGDEPGDRRRLFELGQAEYWLGVMRLEAGDFHGAAESFDIYANLTRRLLRAEPENAEWVLEMAYALSNLGMLEVRREPSDPEQALDFLQSALEYNQIALVLDPGNELYRAELEQSHANVADAQMEVCDLGGALNSRMESFRLAREFYEESPADVRKKRLLAHALSGLASVQQHVGLGDMALVNWRESEQLLTELARAEPGDASYDRLRVIRRSRRVALLAEMGRADEAAVLATDVHAEWSRLFSGSAATAVQTRVEYAAFLLARARAVQFSGEQGRSDAFLNEAIDELARAIDAAPELGAARIQLARAVYRYWERHGRRPAPEIEALAPLLSGTAKRALSCQYANLAAREALVRGDLQAAQRYTAFLLDKGYFEPGFIRFCRMQNLCPDR